MVSKHLKLKFHDKIFNQYTQIDKFLFVPKKLLEDFQEGEMEFLINGKKTKTRVYDIFCDCRPEKHTHRIVDLREQASNLGLKNGQEVEITL